LEPVNNNGGTEKNKDKTVCSWMKTPYKSTAFTILDSSGEARKKHFGLDERCSQATFEKEHEHDIDDEWEE
jgi:hypothetical protein